ncbi:trehalose-phosphatase [Pedococcus bigeumensis]|uniref:trehalose-phosphatase n=1 Tax=Pedococcus bigeumensis TaxID=433644 RepID=UPI002FEB9545
MTLPPDLVAALDRLAAAPRVLVASDFDGVLAPLVPDPSQSRALPGTIEALEGLAALPDTHAAVVSGRDLDTLTSLTGLAGSAVTRIGTHGAETSRATAADLTPEQQQTLDEVTRDLEAVCEGRPEGVHLESKPSAVVLHTRRMTDRATADAVEAAALEVTSRHTGLHVLHGKQVVEVGVVRADKGTALVALRDEVGADQVAYFGDDVTDEDAFRALGADDVTVKVGDGETAARFRVEHPEDAAEALIRLFRSRSR